MSRVLGTLRDTGSRYLCRQFTLFMELLRRIVSHWGRLPVSLCSKLTKREILERVERLGGALKAMTDSFISVLEEKRDSELSGEIKKVRTRTRERLMSCIKNNGVGSTGLKSVLSTIARSRSLTNGKSTIVGGSVSRFACFVIETARTT